MPSAADVEAWCEDHAGCNIALRLPPGIIGIDADAWKGPAELAAWQDMLNRYGPLPELAPWCSSRDDGASGIRLLAVSEDYTAETDMGIAGEVIQHFHRYVVAPPSIHPDTGKPYRWVGQPDGRIPDARKLPRLPEAWLEALRAGSVNGGKAGTGWTDPDIDALIEHGIPGTSPRHDEQLRDVVWKLRAQKLSRPAIQAIWRSIVAKTPLKDPARPWTDADFDRHWQGADRKQGADRPGPEHDDENINDLISDTGTPGPPKRHEVKAGNRNPVDIADDVAKHLLATNDPPRLFSMGATAVVFTDDGSLTPLDPDGWLYYVARRVNFCVTGKDGEPRIVQPPAGAMKIIPSVVIPGLPPLDGIAATPYLDRAGNVISGDGYNEETRLILHRGDFQLPNVSDEPSAGDVTQAVKLLHEEWLADFPFKGDADKANAIAVLLTLTGRMFFALAPLFVFDASTAGSGKGLLVVTISLIATGEAPYLMELPADGEEQRKKITSALLAGHELIVWDESHVIACRTLAAILTAERYSDRLLGGNKMISVVNRFTQVALGNNVEVWGDVKRRVVPSRLVPDVEHPEDRTDFRHADLEAWVLSHRGQLLASVLTIWRNWIAKGRPGAATGMGSFERWARTVGGALQAAGIGAFRANTVGWLDAADDDDGWRNHLAELRGRWGDDWFTVADVAAAVESPVIPFRRPPVKRDPDKTIAELIGYGYRKIREKWYGNLRLVRSEDRNSASGGRQWKVSMREERPDHHQHGQDHQPETEHPDDADHQNPATEPCDPRSCRDPACSKPRRRGCSTCWEHASQEAGR